MKVDKDRFWEIVSASRVKSGGRMGRQLDALREALSNLSLEEIIDYQKHFYGCMDQAYNWDLWGAAYLIQGACSDDDFMDFRSWLISMGKDIFEASLKDVE